MHKAARQALIGSLVSESAFSSIEDLRAALAEHDVRCDSSTLSRDIAELGLVKYAGAWRKPETVDPTPAQPALLKSLIVRVEAVGAMVVIRTRSGAAQSVAVLLDSNAEYLDYAGSVAGDDTIFVQSRTVSSARRTIGWLEEILA